MSSINYVADHIDRIERRHGGNLSLFPYGKLAADGTLTLDQITQIDAYIEKFKATPAGREALAQYQRRAS